MAHNTILPHLRDAESREILRLNRQDEMAEKNKARRERFEQMIDATITGLPYENLPGLSFDAMLRALTDISKTGKYTLPAEMPKCERNAVYSRFDKIARQYVPAVQS